MKNDSDNRHRQPLGAALREILASGGEAGPSIASMTAAVGEKGFGLLLMVLALPSALPIPAPGYSTPFGIVIGFVALQMIFGRSEIWVPEKLRGKRLSAHLARKLLGAASYFLRKIERFIRPRQRWMRARLGHVALGVVVAAMACLMILPIPLTNTFPAMVVFLIGVSLSEEDGWLALGALAVGAAALLLYAGVIYLLITQGPEAINTLKDGVKSLLGLA